jgi:hypothetical protein
MALILNASCEDQHVVVFGNHFSLKAGQIKNFEDKIAHFLATDRADRGLVSLPDEFMEPEYKTSEDGARILEEKRKQGVENRVRYLRQIAYNNEVSLRQDLEKANIKADPKSFASDGELRAYEELVKYQKKQDDGDAKKAAKIVELQKQLKAGV